jgi:hypothetical protein
MDEDGARADETFQATKKNTRDGSIDFSTYSVEQLRELQYSIDPLSAPS